MKIDDTDFRLMIESVTDYGIFLLDTDGVIQTWNAGAAKIKGYAAAEIIGKHFSIFYPAEMVERGWPAHELEATKTHGRFEDEGWRIRKDGTRFWANIILTRLDDRNGKLRGFSKITRDLSERRRQEELLRYSEERFRLLVEGVKDYAIFMLDPSGHIMSWNIGAKLNKGYEEAEIIGKHFSIFYPPEVIASGLPELELVSALKDGRYEDEGWRLRKDGSRFWANVVITALFDAAGRHRGFAKVTRDLTERRKISNLEMEGQQTTRFLAMLGHELRNPLAPIANALAVMAINKSDSDTARAMQQVIGRQMEHMTQIIDDLLDVSRIVSGKITLDRKPVKLNDVVHDALETVQPMAQQKNTTLNFTPPDAPLWVTGDRTRLIQIFVNLLTNALKFTPAQGQVTVTLGIDRAHAEYAEIAVIDNGVGIPPNLLPNIFQLFVQGDQDAARTHGGLGLGLSLVRDLVGLHNGSVTALSAGVAGRGSEFIIQLPRIAAPRERAPRTEQLANATTPKQLLIVDDNIDAANTLSLLLKTTGYSTHVVYQGADALEFIRHHNPDAVLMDIGLPDVSGIDVANAVMKEITDPPPLIAITGYGQETDRVNSLKAGFHAHLTKPLDVAHLIALLKKILQ